MLIAEDEKMTLEVLGIMISRKFPDIASYFAENGNHDFLPKPIEFGKLFAAIEKCIAEIVLERQ
jgi:FixJ family two-component response regulator